MCAAFYSISIPLSQFSRFRPDMNHRFYKIWLALSFFSGAANAASNAAWNCEQNKKGEWTCLNQGTASPEPAKPQITKPQPAEAVQQPRPQAVQAQPVAPQPVIPTAPVQQTAQPEPKTLQPEPTKVAEQPTPKTADAEPAKLAEHPAVEPAKMRVKVTENQKPQLEKVDAVREPVTTAAKQSGWTCKSGDEKQNWNCNLVGPDPKGEAQVVTETQVESHLLTPTFNHSQERTFQTLRAEFDQDPWQNCQTWSTKKRKTKSTSQEARENATTDVNADFSEIFEGDVLNFAGNVDLTRADQHLMADKASYDTVAETMDAQGNVIYSEDQLALSSDTASLSLAKDEARLRKALFIAGEAPLRGSAETVYRDSKILSRYNEAAFTSCPPGNQDWIAHASRLKINRETGQGAAKHAWLEFKGVPVLYTPYISFPTDNRRLSGLLAPTWGSTQRNGFDTSIPFYWNIAPNFDTVITPRYMAKRGGMLRNKFRYLTETSRGTFGTEYMPYDQILDKARYSASLKDQSVITPNLRSYLDLNYVSDKTYFNDLNNALGFQSSSYLPSQALLSYGQRGIGLSAAMVHYQSVDKTITDAQMPYDILPRVALNLNHNFDSMPVTLAMDNQYSYFYHSEHVNGQRLNLAPSLSVPLESSAGFFIPRITAQYTQYELSGQTAAEQLAGQPTSISRMLPIFSADSGMSFEKQLDFGGSPYTHTLEPRAFYLYIPRKDQSNIPLFDTSTFDTNFYSLFRENRFSGLDRVQEANQITLAATSRLIDSTTGLEPLKLSLGQILYFQDRTVDLDYLNNTHATQTSKTSNFIGEVSGQMTKNLSYLTGAQWDPEANSLARGQAVLKFRNQPDEIFDIGYRYRRKNLTDPTTRIQPTTISQTDVSFRWPLFGQWYGLGRWQYSLNFDKTTESFIGLEKENCCWRFRIIGRRFINGTNTTNAYDAKPETAFFVQLELKGLTSFGDSVDTFLQTNLNGYRKAGYFD
jgi:LPS-assembly protein